MAQPQEQPERYTGETLPAWSLPAAASAEIGIGVEWPERVTREGPLPLASYKLRRVLPQT